MQRKGEKEEGPIILPESFVHFARISLFNAADPKALTSMN